MSDNDKITTPLDVWIRNNHVDDNLLWMRAAEAQFEEWQKVASWFGVKAEVISMHRSKSCKLPVVLYELGNGARVVARDNFYNIMVSVTAPAAVRRLPVQPTAKDINSVYCEGFLDEWVFPSWHRSPSQFTIELQTIGQLVDLIGYVVDAARAA